MFAVQITSTRSLCGSFVSPAQTPFSLFTVDFPTSKNLFKNHHNYLCSFCPLISPCIPYFFLFSLRFPTSFNSYRIRFDTSKPVSRAGFEGLMATDGNRVPESRHHWPKKDQKTPRGLPLKMLELNECSIGKCRWRIHRFRDGSIIYGVPRLGLSTGELRMFFSQNIRGRRDIYFETNNGVKTFFSNNELRGGANFLLENYKNQYFIFQKRSIFEVIK